VLLCRQFIVSILLSVIRRTIAMDEKQVPVLDSMDDLVRQLRVVFQSDSVNVDYVRALLAAYKSNPKDWKQYAVFDPYRLKFEMKFSCVNFS